MKAELGLIPRILGYRLFRTIGRPGMMPINVTVSITNKCNSQCKTCFIWKLYRKHPEKVKDELKIEEFERAFKGLGEQVYWATISGGEPYLRRDLPHICESLNELCSPAIINIPTNGLLPSTIESKTKEILQRCPDTTLIVNLSLDGVDGKHDKIRGVPGNFIKLQETYNKLVKLKQEFPRLKVGIHTVISKLNISEPPSIYKYVKKLDPDSYITEVAEQRAELFNVDKDITPIPESYAQVINELSHKVRRDYLQSKKNVSRLTQAFRLEYYRIAAKELLENRQIIPCYAGYASCQITPYGDVWPCCVLGYDKSMGNLRDNNYDFRKIWFSQRAKEIRSFIKAKNCACPLANAGYTSILCNLRSMYGVLKNVLWKSHFS